MAFCIGITVSLSVGYIFDSAPAAAQTVEQLQAQIAERSARLGEIEKEIAQFESALKRWGPSGLP